MNDGGRVDWLVVGLGNPGDRYARTRHNIGFEVANELARRWDLPRAKKKYAGLFTDGRTGPGGPRVALLLPQTFMNEAGRSVGPARGALGVDLDHVLVDPRRDRPAVRRGRVAPRRRAGRPQRPEVAEARARLRRLPPRARGRRAARLDRPGDRLRATCSAGSPSPRTRSRALIERAADEAERLLGRSTDRLTVSSTGQWVRSTT